MGKINGGLDRNQSEKEKRERVRNIKRDTDSELTSRNQ